MLKCSSLLVLPILFVSLSAMAQPSGYLIATSTAVRDGTVECADSCVTDADCFEDQCIDAFLDGPGQTATRICGQRRFGHLDLSEYQACSASLCGVEQACLRSPGLLELERFVTHKRSRGFDVHVFTSTAWGGGEGQAAADNLRNWLTTITPALAIEYVLLIGDPRPNVGPLPMKKTWPEHNAQQTWATPNSAVPTDYYYADLRGDWDLDGDGFPGEWGDINEAESVRGDFGPGGIERAYTVKVGRIPWYGPANSSEVDHILSKTIAYQDADPASIQWRKSALVAAEGENRFFFGESIRTDVLEPNGYGSYRVYDAHCLEREASGGAACQSPIDGIPDALECTPQNVIDGLDTSPPGMVFWLTHGSGQGAISVMSTALTPRLDDSKPVFTFQASCYNSQPETQNNVSYALLKNGAINTIGATRISHGPGSPVSLPNTAGNAGMAYEYARRLVVERQNSGTALMELKQNLPLENRWWYWKNLCGFNIYGDPEVGIHDVHIEPPPPPPDAGFTADAASVLDVGHEADARSFEDAQLPSPDAQIIAEPTDAGVRPLMMAKTDDCSCTASTTESSSLAWLIVFAAFACIRLRPRV